MGWFDELLRMLGLLGRGGGGVDSMDTAVQQLEARADSEEAKANLRRRAREARGRIKEAKRVAPKNTLLTWGALVVMVIVIIIFFRGCI